MTARTEIAVRVEHVSKQFRLGRRHNEFPTLRESVMSTIAGAARRVTSLGRAGLASASEGEILHALADVSFDVKRGETLGIIGANGAGKSTLLKVLARVTEPTAGRVELHGRLGSLLEVGTGFHQELTGRENIFLNGAILGMRQSEIRQRFDEIVAFSEVERFIDTPVKFYSSGMYLRLAFAVAAHLEPEILLMDEVLAVGDAAFQEKCLGKMSEVAKQGRTILFVSHNLAAMEGFCDRVIWMRDGRVAEDGPTTEIISRYLGTSTTSVTEQRWSERAAAPGNELVRMHAARVRPRDGAVGDVISVTTPLVFEFEYWPDASQSRLVPTMYLLNGEGALVFRSSPADPGPLERRSGERVLVQDDCHVPGNLLNNGVHRVSFALASGPELVYWVDDLLTFDVRDTAEMRNGWYGTWDGAVRPVLDWQRQTLGDSPTVGPSS